jgi:hypothetical protein
MAMLSSDKINLFNDKFIDLIEFLMVSIYNKTDEKASLGSFILDQITLNESLDYKVDPNINLVTYF